MEEIAVVTSIPPDGTTPSMIPNCLRATAANMIEVTGIAALGNTLYLLRWYPSISANKWRPWKSDRPFTPDAAGYFSGCIELPDSAGSEYFVLFSTSTAEGNVTDAYARATTYR